MITGAQIREAWQLLRWAQKELARRSKVPLTAVIRAEGVAGEPAITMAQATAVQRALEAAGVIFVEENGDGPGVRLRKGRA